MKRNGSAVWKGDLKSGQGTVSTESGVLSDTQYSFKTRFEEGKGTNPEELVGAAHAGCFSMFLSALLTDAGFTPTRVSTTAAVHLDDGPEISLIELSTEAVVPDLTEAVFLKHAEAAKKGCPVSKALTGPKITLTAKLVT